MNQKLLTKILNRTTDLTMNPNIWGSDKHLMTLFSIALQMRSKQILELGIYSGRTSDPLLLAAEINNGKLTSVDIVPPRCEWQCPTELMKYYEFIQNDAIQFLEKCVRDNKIFDFIFIDDWHAYNHVKKELELIDKISNPKTIILLHDLMARLHEPNYYNSIKETGEFDNGGPFRAVHELNTEIWEWATIPTDNGLTLLRKKGEVLT